MRRRRHLIVLALGLLALLVWWFWPTAPKPSDPDRPTTVDTRTLKTETLIAMPSGNQAGSSPMGGEMMPVRPVTERDQWQSSLSILVMDADTQRPIPGVKIYLSGPIHLPPAFSDIDGNARYLGLPAGLYYCTLVHDTYSSKSGFRLKPIEISDREHKEVLLEMNPACVASGRVVDARTGEPIRGALIFPNRYEENKPVESDANGRFSVGTGEATKADFYIRAEGFSPQEKQIGCTDGKKDLGDIMLNGAWTLVGRVIDELGEPLPGVTVQDYPRLEDQALPSNILLTVTDSDGRFEMTGLPTTDERIYFYKDGYNSTTASVNPTTPREFEVQMTRACLLRGIVQDLHEKPIEGVIASVMNSDRRFQGGAISSNSGDFQLEANSGEVDLILQFHDASSEIRRFMNVECSPEMEPIVLKLDIGNDTRASGTVVNADDTPVANAVVMARSAQPGAGRSASSRHTVTDEGGAFTISVPAEGDYRIRAFSLDPMQMGMLSGLEGEESGLKITLQAFGHMSQYPETGIVVDADGNQIGDYLYRWDSRRVRQSCDADGNWQRNEGWPMDMPPLWIYLPDGGIGRHDMRGEQKDVAVVGNGAPLTAEIGNSFPPGYVTVSLWMRSLIDERVIERAVHYPLLPPGIYSLSFTASDGRRRDIAKIPIVTGVPNDLGVIELTPDE